MKTTQTFCCLLLSFVLLVQFLSAQNLQSSPNVIITWKSKSKEISFPFIKQSVTLAVADTLNHHLQMNELGFVLTKYNAQKLDDALASEEESGSKSIDYEIMGNNNRFLSFRFSHETEGNYPDGYDSYYTFDAQTGKEIVLDSLFTTDGFAETDSLIIHARKDTITNFTAKLDTSDETQREQYELYTRCLNSCDEDISSGKWYLSKDTLTVLMEDRCSNHAERAIDDLWDIPVKIPFTQLFPMLSEYGKKILIGTDRRVTR